MEVAENTYRELRGWSWCGKEPELVLWDGVGWDGMGWEEMGWDGVGRDGMEWDGMG